MALFRRIIYMSDEDWEEVREAADAAGLSMSAYIRMAVRARKAMSDTQISANALAVIDRFMARRTRERHPLDTD